MIICFLLHIPIQSWTDSVQFSPSDISSQTKNWIPFIRFGQKWAWTCYFTLKQAYGRFLDFLKGPNLTPQITFRLGIWIPLIRFGQHLETFRNKHVENFSFFSKSKMATDGQKLKFTFWLRKWIPFIRFRQILLETYYSTLRISLQKIFWPIAKSKMAAMAANTAIMKSVITWKIYKLETHFFLDPCFQG